MSSFLLDFNPDSGLVQLTAAPTLLRRLDQEMDTPVMDEQPMRVFPLFSQFPVDIRRRIWLATLGPMTVTFDTKLVPRGDEDLSEGPAEDISCCTPERLAYYTAPPLFSNFSRYNAMLSYPTEALAYTLRSRHLQPTRRARSLKSF